MCDTLVALGNATVDGSVIFAKNSDREPNEAHEVITVPAQEHARGSDVHCTYISIPQAEHTNAVLLAKPFWIWGAEMGANEHGVMIGNEALFTRAPYGKEPGLIGMDFLRLALERAATARGALDVIVQLLETYGQSGNCGFSHPFFYHNSYLIADRKDAWVLQTVDRLWAAIQVKDVVSISNGLTIGSEWDLATDHLVDKAVAMKLFKATDEFNFSRCLSDPLYTFFSDAVRRRECTQSFLDENKGRIEVKMIMDLLRSHGEVAPARWRPDRALIGNNVCMHAGFGPVRIDQSVGSLVSHLTPDLDTHWLTGTSAPCTGVFKPVYLDAGLPDLGPSPKGTYDTASLFWRHERLHRAILKDPSARLPVVQSERDPMEKRMIAAEASMVESSPSERLAFSQICFSETELAEEKWFKKVSQMPINTTSAVYYRKAWQQFNQHAGFPEPF